MSLYLFLSLPIHFILILLYCFHQTICTQDLESTLYKIIAIKYFLMGRILVTYVVLDSVCYFHSGLNLLIILFSKVVQIIANLILYPSQYASEKIILDLHIETPQNH